MVAVKGKISPTDVPELGSLCNFMQQRVPMPVLPHGPDLVTATVVMWTAELKTAFF